MSWISEDITWCGNECKNEGCMRNPANRLSKAGIYTEGLLKGTELCPGKKWVEVHGYCTAGGDPVFKCPSCGKDEHVAGIEHHKNEHNICEYCGSFNLYPWEKKEMR